MKRTLAMVSLLLLLPALAHAQSGAAQVRNGTAAQRPPTCRTSRGEVYYQIDGDVGLYDCPNNAWRRVTDHSRLANLAADDHPHYQLRSERNAANGYAGLDGSGLLPDIRLPASIARDSEVTAAVAAHEALADPHPQYSTQAETDARYYTEAETDDLLAAKAAAAHGHTLAEITDEGTAAGRNVPSSGDAAAAEVVLGSDSRLSNARTPLSHSHSGAEITSGTVAEARLPTGIDAAKIADGSVSNAEYQRLDGVSSAIQPQLDGKAASTHAHAAGDITSGTIAAARLGGGTASGSTFLRGDSTWATITAGDVNANATRTLNRLTKWTDATNKQIGNSLLSDDGIDITSTGRKHTLTSGTVTASNPALDITQTWNAGAVAFTGFRFNVTDTASSGSSLLMDLQRNSASVFSVRRDGRLSIAEAFLPGNAIFAQDGTASVPGYSFIGSTSSGMYRVGGALAFAVGGTQFQSMSSATVTVSSGIALRLSDSGTKPTCDSTQRGKIWVDEGGAGVKDSAEICLKDASDAYAWRTIY